AVRRAEELAGAPPRLGERDELALVVQQRVAADMRELAHEARTDEADPDLRGHRPTRRRSRRPDGAGAAAGVGRTGGGGRARGPARRPNRASPTARGTQPGTPAARSAAP